MIGVELVEKDCDCNSSVGLVGLLAHALSVLDDVDRDEVGRSSFRTTESDNFKTGIMLD